MTRQRICCVCPRFPAPGLFPHTLPRLGERTLGTPTVVVDVSQDHQGRALHPLERTKVWLPSLRRISNFPVLATRSESFDEP